jgi:hypothetical protein
VASAFVMMRFAASLISNDVSIYVQTLHEINKQEYLWNYWINDDIQSSESCSYG